MKGRKNPGRPRKTLLDWLMKREYKVDYSQPNRMVEDTNE